MATGELDTAEPHTETSPIHSLPEEVLIKVFCRVCAPDGKHRTWLYRHLPLVCRKWAYAYARPSPLWQDLLMVLPVKPSAVQWLQDRVPSVQALRIEGPPELGPREYPYDGPANRELYRQAVASVALPGPATVLSELSRPSAALQGACMGAGLERLELIYARIPKLTATSLASISTLVSLSSLEIQEDYSRDFWKYDLLTEAQRGSLWSAIVTLGGTLTRLLLSGVAVRNPNAEGRLLRMPVPDTITSLKRLRELRLDNNGFFRFPDAMNNFCLQKLCIGDEWASLKALSGLVNLTNLEILAHIFIPDDLDLTRNPCLESFRVVLWNGTYQFNGSLDDKTFARVLQGVSGLKMLSLENVGLTEVPAPILQMQHLRILDLRMNDFQDLPAGKYLSGITTLDLSGNASIGEVPKALRQAGNLEVLALHDMMNMSLTGDCIKVLEGLSKLTKLDLSCPSEGSDDGDESGSESSFHENENRSAVGRLSVVGMLQHLRHLYP